MNSPYVTINGFLIGVYDSRSGTTFVEADSLDEAFEIFCKEMGVDETCMSLEYIELTCRGKLFVPKSFADTLNDPKRKVLDLEELPPSSPKSKDMQVLLEWDPVPEDDCFPDEMFDNKDTCVSMELVEEGSKPVNLKTSYHPNWYDDGWSFILIKK